MPFVGLSQASGQSALLSYFDLPANTWLCCEATDNAGNLFLVYATYNPSSADYGTSVGKFDSAFHSTSSVSLTVPFAPQAVVVDSSGNLWIAGFNIVMRLASSSSPALSVSLGGPPNGPDSVVASISAMAADSSGDIYVTGTTNQAAFPVTPGAFQGFPTTPPTYVGGFTFGFVTKISSAGKILLSTLVRGLKTACQSFCTAPVTTNPEAIALDASGDVTIAGSTDAIDYPVSPNAPQTVCNCGSFYAQSAFITRLNPDFSALRWSTFLGGESMFVSGLAAEPDGGVVVVGETLGGAGLPTTPGAVDSIGGGFATRLNSSGTAWVFSTYLGGSALNYISGVQTDSTGNSWIAGRAYSPGFPFQAGNLQLGTDFVLELAPDGSRFQLSEGLPAGTAGGGIVKNGDATFTVLGPSTYTYFYIPSVSLLRLPAGPVEGISILGVADSAATSTAATVAPGEFLSLYGTGLGPAPGLGAALDSAGRIGAELGGVSVLFDGQRAPLLWVSANQINLLVPYEIANRDQTTLQVITSAGSSQTLALTVVPARPYLFVVVNADGTINGPGHPAVDGSVLTLYAGGAGTLNESLPDGSLAGNPAPSPSASVGVSLSNGCAEAGLPLLYAGGSPGSAVNVLQVNFQWQPLPWGGIFSPPCDPPFIQILVGKQHSPPYQIY